MSRTKQAEAVAVVETHWSRRDHIRQAPRVRLVFGAPRLLLWPGDAVALNDAEGVAHLYRLVHSDGDKAEFQLIAAGGQR